MRRQKIEFKLLDAVVILLFAALAGFVVYRLAVQLNYRWNWGIIPQYLVRYDQDRGGWTTNVLLEGLFTSIRLSFWASILAALLGLVMGVTRTARKLLFRLLGGTYVELIRNTPPLVLVFIFYFFVSDQIMPVFGVEEFIRSRSPETQEFLSYFFATPDLFTAFISGAVTVAFFQGAYMTEIVRAGLESLEKGQWEASYALGLSWRQQMQYVIFPQAFKRVLPPLANEFINTIKYSAIVSVISIQELTFQGFQVMAATQVTIEVWLTITVMYLALCLSLSLLVQALEKRLARNDAR
ncbi:MAG: amino acid ABC transporter permease [Pseudomonadota bacterium]